MNVILLPMLYALCVSYVVGPLSAAVERWFGCLLPFSCSFVRKSRRFLLELYLSRSFIYKASFPKHFLKVVSCTPCYNSHLGIPFWAILPNTVTCHFNRGDYVRMCDSSEMEWGLLGKLYNS